LIALRRNCWRIWLPREKKIRTELKIGTAHARLLLKRLDIAGVADVYEVAHTLKLRVTEEELDGCEGLLIRPQGIPRGIIAVKKSIRSEGRKRFTIAHEIGHYVLPGHDEYGSICEANEIEGWRNGANIAEREADDFAAELLIPTAVVRSRIVGSSPSLDLIQTIAEDCKSSLASSAWKYCDLTSEQCAVVWSEQGQVAWSRRSAEFPFFVRKGQMIKQASFAFNCFRGEKVPSGPALVPAEAWIESTNLKEGAEIYEQSRALPSYGSVLTLIWAKHNIEKKSDYQEQEDESLDPKEFTVYRKHWPH